MSLKKKAVGLVAATLMGLATVTPSIAAPARVITEEAMSQAVYEHSTESVKKLLSSELDKLERTLKKMLTNLEEEKKAIEARENSIERTQELIEINKRISAATTQISIYAVKSQLMYSQMLQRYYKARDLGPVVGIYTQVGVSGSWSFKAIGNKLRKTKVGNFIAPGSTNVGAKFSLSGGTLHVVAKNKITKNFVNEGFAVTTAHIAANIATPVQAGDAESHSVRTSVNIGFIIPYQSAKKILLDADKTLDQVVASEDNPLLVSDLFSSYAVRHSDSGRTSKFYIPGNVHLGHSVSSLLGIVQFSIGLNAAPLTDSSKNTSYGVMKLFPLTRLFSL